MRCFLCCYRIINVVIWQGLVNKSEISLNIFKIKKKESKTTESSYWLLSLVIGLLYIVYIL